MLVLLFLTDPVFVGSAYIEESQPIGNPVGDDDKIYFFFSEAGKEIDFFDNTIVSRIARVCKVRLGWGWVQVITQDGHAKVTDGAGLKLPLLNPNTISSKKKPERSYVKASICTSSTYRRLSSVSDFSVTIQTCFQQIFPFA